MRLILSLGAVFLFFGAACGGSSAQDEGDGGAAGTSGTGQDSGVTAVVCTSNTFWRGGDKGSELMHPGGACLTCHATNRDAPKFQVAGTVYPSSHEPDDCNGSNGTSDLSIVIVDATGKLLAPIPVNNVGNFHYQGTIAAPFHVKIVSKSGKESAMGAAPPSGDCNSCHTRDGANSAPGRIVAP